MKKLLVLLIVTVMATSAFATLDPDPNMVGIYFDEAALTNCGDIAPFSPPVPLYIVLTQPGAPVSGFELGYDVSVPAGMEASYLRTSSVLPAGGVDLGTSADPMTGDYIVGFAAPYPPVDGAVTLVTWGVSLFAPMAVDLFLGPPSQESIADGLPAYVANNDGVKTVEPLGLSTGGVSTPVASINGGLNCPVGNEAVSFGSVKGLFR